VKKFILIFLLCSAVLAIGQDSSKALSPLEQTLITAEKAIPEAEMKRDSETLKRLLSDDFLQVSIDGKLNDRDEIIGMMSEITIKQFRTYDFKVVPVTENVAIVTYDAILEVTSEDDDIRIPRYQHWSSVWVKQGEQWKLKFQQATAAM
jgi:hypothetical protein